MFGGELQQRFLILAVQAVIEFIELSGEQGVVDHLLLPRSLDGRNPLLQFAGHGIRLRDFFKFPVPSSPAVGARISSPLGGLRAFGFVRKVRLRGALVFGPFRGLGNSILRIYLLFKALDKGNDLLDGRLQQSLLTLAAQTVIKLIELAREQEAVDHIADIGHKRLQISCSLDGSNLLLEFTERVAALEDGDIGLTAGQDGKLVWLEFLVRLSSPASQPMNFVQVQRQGNKNRY